jgi:hypothetical protein
MKNETLQVNFSEGTSKGEIIIREVAKVNELDVKAPVKLAITGTLSSVFEFLNRRFDQKEQINQKRCHILVDREDISIELIFNENDEYTKGTVKGTMLLNAKFEEFGINSGKVWTPTQLGLFFKMNRAFFTSKEDNMRLVNELMNFTATVNNSIEKAAKENGDRTDKFAQTVNSNLPAAFTLKIPIFKSLPAETLEVETFAQVNGREISFTLISPAANQTMEELRDLSIDKELEQIRSLTPDIAIIEK